GCFLLGQPGDRVMAMVLLFLLLNLHNFQFQLFDLI
ncbi:MAG: hypothetical protein ACI90V_007474, partial [Bacillariaceae sp.]